jgi:hypothetical protein
MREEMAGQGSALCCYCSASRASVDSDEGGAVWEGEERRAARLIRNHETLSCVARGRTACFLHLRATVF